MSVKCSECGREMAGRPRKGQLCYTCGECVREWERAYRDIENGMDAAEAAVDAIGDDQRARMRRAFLEVGE